jgi:hypothetical protein
MDKSINLYIVEIKENILNEIKKSNLPITIIQMIVNEIANVINAQADNIVKKEKVEYLKQKEENKDEN